jgi:pseudouridine synthase
MEAARFPSELRDIFPLGRIDKDSRGLILLTNDGRVTKRLLSPESEHEKEYVVKTAQPLRNGFKAAIERGVDIGGYTTLPCKINLMGEKEFSIKLTEGKRHQIRRMVVALHNDVVDLRRVRVANIQLGRLREGDWRHIEDEELHDFLGSLGL